MNKRHTDFDAKKLFERKEHYCGYRFCPLCGKMLQEGEIEGQSRMRCPDEGCGFIFYQNPTPAAGAIVVKDNKVLLVKRAHPPKIGSWCIPAGFMEWHEHPSQTAERELQEETGLIVKMESLFEIYTGVDDPRSNSVLILYLGNVVGGELCAADDALDVGYFSLDALPEDIAFESHFRAFADYQNRLGNRATTT